MRRNVIAYLQARRQWNVLQRESNRTCVQERKFPKPAVLGELFSFFVTVWQLTVIESYPLGTRTGPTMIWPMGLCFSASFKLGSANLYSIQKKKNRRNLNEEFLKPVYIFLGVCMYIVQPSISFQITSLSNSLFWRFIFPTPRNQKREIGLIASLLCLLKQT